MRYPLLVVVALALGVAACTQPPPPRPLVVASFYPLYEFARQVAGDRAEVVSLVPPGVEPHDWEPSPPDVARLQKARLVVYNGAGFEPWIDRLLKDLPGGGPLAVKTTERVDLIVADLPGHDEPGPARPATGATGATAAGGHALDPHVWLDPLLAQTQVEAIRAGLAQIDPAGAGAYADRARVFADQLTALHTAFEGGLARCARRDVVVSHAAFGYLARRYHLAQVPVMGLAPEAEPSPAALAALVRFAQRQRVQYIFFETLVSPKLAETLAREVGARTLVLNPIEGLTKEEAAAGKGYLSLMRENLRSLRTALECQ
jgi:zinc transport system substrate-binding protein